MFKKVIKTFLLYTRMPLRIILSIAFLFLFYKVMRWWGFRGFIAFTAGMSLMGYLLLSKNKYLMFAVRFANAEAFIDEVRDDKKENKENKEKQEKDRWAEGFIETEENA